MANSPDTRLRGIRIYDFDQSAKLASVTDAAEGAYIPPASWRLSGVVQTVLHGERAEVVKLPDLEWHSALNPDILGVLMVVLGVQLVSTGLMADMVMRTYYESNDKPVYHIREHLASEIAAAGPEKS